jgi:hypothetical protein
MKCLILCVDAATFLFTARCVKNSSISLLPISLG